MPVKRLGSRCFKLTKEETEPREDRAGGQGLELVILEDIARHCTYSEVPAAGREQGESWGCRSGRSDLGGDRAKRALEGVCFPGEDGSGWLARQHAQPRGLAGRRWPIPREGPGHLCFETLLYPVQIWGAKFEGAPKSLVKINFFF